MKFRSLEGEIVELTLPEGGVVDDLRTDVTVSEPVAVQLPATQLGTLKTYLETGVVGNVKDLLRAVEYFQIDDVPADWLKIKRVEDEFRTVVGTGALSPHHGLLELTEAKLTEIVGGRPGHRSTNVIRSMSSKWSPWYPFQRLRSFADALALKSTPEKGVLLAGGALVSYCLSQQPPKDYDLFLYGYTEPEALQVIDKFIKLPKTSSFFTGYKNYRTIHRNKYTITCGDIQFILRLYKSPAEILHGFDIDCCRVGYDGEKVWMTQSALWAWQNRMNVVDFSRMSPSYDYRMGKYANRGFDIRVPFFDVRRAKLYLVPEISARIRDQHFLNKRHPGGLSKIVYMSYSGKSRKERGDSDYDPDWSIRKMDLTYQKTSKMTDTLYVRGMSGKIVAMVHHSCVGVEELSIKASAGRGSVFEDDELDMPRKVEFLTVDPGRQSTGTFHPLVLTDRSQWYIGELYA